MVEPPCSNFRVITAIFPGVQIGFLGYKALRLKNLMDTSYSLILFILNFQHLFSTILEEIQGQKNPQGITG